MSTGHAANSFSRTVTRVTSSAEHGTCEYLQKKDSSNPLHSSCETSEYVPIVPTGRPLQAGKEWNDIKHCCVSPCNRSGGELKLADLNLRTTLSATPQGDTNGSRDCDATGRFKHRTNNGQNRRHANCADTAEDIFHKASSGSCDEKDTGVAGETLRELDTVQQLCKAPVIESLADLVTELHRVFETDHVNVEYVEFIMKSYKSKPAEWRKYAKFDKFKYTRNLVDAGNDKFNLMILCWGEGHGSSVHDHADAHCFMKMLDGSLTETRFHWPTSQEEEHQPLKVMGKSQLLLNDVCYINDSLGLHRVENSSYSDVAVSLHLYSPPFNACSVFNERTGHKTISRVTFWSKFGRRDKKTDLTADLAIEAEDN